MLLLWLVVVVVGAVVVVVQVSGWIYQGLRATLPGQPGQFGHSGNEDFTVRRMGSGGTETQRFQFCVTCFDMASICMVFSVLYRWRIGMPEHVDERGWRMMSVRFMQ